MLLEHHSALFLFYQPLSSSFGISKKEQSWRERERGDFHVRSPNNNVVVIFFPEWGEEPRHGKVKVILVCLICMQNMTHEAAGPLCLMYRVSMQLCGGKIPEHGGIEVGLVGSCHLARTL